MSHLAKGESLPQDASGFSIAAMNHQSSTWAGRYLALVDSWLSVEGVYWNV